MAEKLRLKFTGVLGLVLIGLIGAGCGSPSRRYAGTYINEEETVHAGSSSSTVITQTLTLNPDRTYTYQSNSISRMPDFSGMMTVRENVLWNRSGAWGLTDDGEYILLKGPGQAPDYFKPVKGNLQCALTLKIHEKQ